LKTAKWSKSLKDELLTSTLGYAEMVSTGKRENRKYNYKKGHFLSTEMR